MDQPPRIWQIPVATYHRMIDCGALDPIDAGVFGDDRVELLVEISKRSLSDDREKATLYARAGVTEYWIVDVARRRVEAYREPRDGAYASRAVVGEDGAIRPVAFGEIEVRVADLMMPRGA